LVGFGAFGLFWGTWGAALPGIQEHARADDGFLGIALLFIGVGALASMRAAGSLLDGAGRRGLPVALLVFGATALLPALATSPLGLVGALLVVGAASGALDVAINAEGSRYEAAARPVLNLAHAVFSAGVIGASLLIALLRTMNESTFLPFAIAASLLVAAALAVARLPAAPFAAEVSGEASARFWQVPRPLALLGVLGALAYFVENAWQSWSAVHLHSTLDADIAQAALGPAFFAGAALSGRLLGHLLAVRVPPRLLLTTGAGVAAAGTLVAATAASVTIALVGIAIAGLGTSVCAPTVFSLAGKNAAPAQRARAISIVTTLAYSGFLVGPAIVGLAAEATSLRLSLAAVALVAVLLAGLARHAPVRA